MAGKMRSLVFLLAALDAMTVYAEVECEPGPIDIVFAMDQSGSIGRPNYDTMLDAVANMTESLQVGRGNEYSHVGMVVFDEVGQTVFRLDRYNTNEEVKAAIKSSPFSGDGSDIAKGMKQAIDDVFTTTGRKDILKVLVIVSDGDDSSTISDVKVQHDAAEKMGIVIYALGIGDVKVDKLTAATGSMTKVYKANDYGDLATVMNQVCYEIATIAPTRKPTTTVPPPPSYLHKPRDCPCKGEDDYANVWLDIIFVLDSSNGAGRDFTSIRELLKSMASFYPISQQEGKFTRVAVVNVAKEAEVFADFTKWKDGKQMSADINANLKHLGGDFFNPSRGLVEAQTILDKDKEKGVRLNVKKVVVLFTTKDIDCVYDEVKGKRSRIQVKEGEDDPCRLAAHMVIDGVTLLTVALSIPGEEEPVVNVATECFNTTNSQGMVDEILRMLCMANCYCLAPFVQYTSANTKCAKFGECVYVDGLALAYGAAEQTCQDMDGKLTDILSRDKELFLNNLHLDTGFFPYWVGVKYDQGRNAYVWDSLNEDATSDYSRWGGNQPNLAVGECVFQKNDKFNVTWASEKCGRMTPAHYFSCQKKSCDTEYYCDY